MQITEDEAFIVEDAETALRLDKLLALRFLGRYSRNYFQTLIADGLVLINGETAKKRIAVKAGDEIEIQFVYSKEISLDPEPIPLDILYEDEEIIVVNKQKGLVVHPAPGHWSGTFVNGLLYHCQAHTWDSEALKNLRPGIVHRLDKDTTGVLIAAKTRLAQQKLTDSFAKREVYKEYLAICIGNPGKISINAAIGRHPKHRQKMAIVSEGGREALSYVETCKFNQKISLVKVVIATGRTHQIRVHLSHLHTPVLGDPLYGNLSLNQQFRAERAYLHASCLKIPHPISGSELTFQAPLPEDMNRWIAEI